MKNIVIVGFMGTGKTAVAKALARDLGLKYVSVDAVIEEREKRPITDIFRDSGEPYFRKVEKEVVKDLSASGGQVIDTGGGVVLDPDNMTRLKAGGIVVCLWASVQVIHERTSRAGHRPLLNVEDPIGRISELLDRRRPFYEKAEHHVDTDGEKVPAVVEKIKRMIKESGNHGE